MSNSLALVIEVLTTIPNAMECFDRSLGHIIDPFWGEIKHGDDDDELVTVFWFCLAMDAWLSHV